MNLAHVDLDAVARDLQRDVRASGCCSYHGYQDAECCSGWESGQFLFLTVDEVLDTISSCARDPLGRTP